MKKILLVFLALFIASNVNAALVDNGDGTITDTDRGLMYYDYIYYSDGWENAVSWASNLSYAGYNDWKLPSALNPDDSGPCQGFNCDGSDLGHLYYGEDVTPANNMGAFQNLGGLSSDWVWTETEYDQDRAWMFPFFKGNQHAHLKGDLGVAMAVRVVPEPISSILFVAGGTLLTGRRFIRSKKKA